MQSPSAPIEPTLKQRARKGVFWVAFTTIGAKSLSIVTTLILARILSPEAFGLVAVANVVVAALSIFTDLGVGAAIIHSKAPRQRMASTAFFLMPVIGVTLYTISFVTAPVWAHLLGDEDATAITRIVSLTIVLASLALVPSILLEKDMAYRRKVIPDLLPALVYIVSALLFATYFDLGAYSIAYGLVLQSLVNVMLNWHFARWRPSWVFDRSIAGELLGYGKNVLGGGLILYLATNMDNAFISRTNGTAALGQYALAYNVANLPATHVGDVVGRVLLPSMVEINDDPGRLRSVYHQALKVLIVVTFPLLAGIAAIASPLVHVVLGDRWLAVIPALQILVIFAALRVISSATGSLFLATNHSRVILMNGVVGLTGQAIALTLAVVVYDGGLTGASWAVSLSALANGLYIGWWVNRVLPFRFTAALTHGVRLVAPAVLMGASVYVLTEALPVTWWALPLEVAAGGVLYLPLLIVCNGRGIVADLIRIVRTRTA